MRWENGKGERAVLLISVTCQVSCRETAAGRMQWKRREETSYDNVYEQDLEYNAV